jgi:hypothetical protein
MTSLHLCKLYTDLNEDFATILGHVKKGNITLEPSVLLNRDAQGKYSTIEESGRVV